MKLKNIKNEIEKIKLSTEEKEALFKNVIEAPIPSPYAPIPSWFKFTPKPIVYIALCLFLLVVSGGGISYAALNSVPGDKLYSLKVNVSEPILGVLAFSPEAEAKWEETKAIRRLNEASLLAEREELTEERREKIEEKIAKSVEKFNAAIEKIEEKKEKGEDLKLSFEASISAHTNLLKKINQSEEQEKEISSLENVIKAKISNSSKSDENGRGFESRKSSVLDIIEQTERDIEGMTDEGNGNDVLDSIIIESRERLEEAEKTLREAKESKDEGDIEEAKIKIRDSYKAALEADISLKEAIKMKIKKEKEERKNRRRSRD